jgi:two-component system nitrogen regulation sensor histidine kinase NtrY
VDLLKSSVLLQRQGQPDVEIVAEVPDGPVMVDVDATMINQALTNLIKNAGEAIESLEESARPEGFAPRIEVTLTEDLGSARITIADNGIGLPEDRARLFEPYVTTRSEGTGLGLPIVKKIIEEHGGHLALEDAPVFAGSEGHFGAMAVIRLPLGSDPAEQEGQENE